MSVADDVAYWRRYFHIIPIDEETDMRWNEGAGGYENPPCGSHLARCYSLIDLGTQTTTWQGKERKARKVRISFELPYAKMKGEFSPDLQGKPFCVHLTVTQSLHENANLRRFLEGWRGKRFDGSEIESFYPKRLIDQPCRLSLVEGNSGFINVDSISPATVQEKEAMPPLTVPTVYLSLDPEEFDQEAFHGLTEKTKEKILPTPEWRALHEVQDREINAGDAGAPPEDYDYDQIPF